MKFSQKVRDDAVDYSLDSIKYICKEIGPRESGMPNERQAQEWLKNEVLSNKWADEAELQDFTVSRHALVGFSKICAGLMLIAVALQFFAYFLPNYNIAYSNVAIAFEIISALLALLTLTITIMEFLMYKPFVDPILPKTTSCNMYATKKPKGEVKRRIIFSGHCDSAYEWTLMKIKPAFMIVCLAGAILGVIVSIGVFIYSATQPAPPIWAFALTVAFAPFYVSLFFFCNFKVVVPGANDNLTGVLASVAVLKCLSDEGIQLENTEVCFLSTGSEEAGLRGAFAWAKKYKKEILESDVETIMIALETLRDWDHLSIYVRDMTMTVKHDAGVIKLLDKASANCGRPLSHENVFFGASDAAAITKLGLRATCLAGMDPTPANYYHNTKDDADNMDRKTYAFGLDVALEALELFDKEGAPS